MDPRRNNMDPFVRNACLNCYGSQCFQDQLNPPYYQYDLHLAAQQLHFFQFQLKQSEGPRRREDQATAESGVNENTTKKKERRERAVNMKHFLIKRNKHVTRSCDMSGYTKNFPCLRCEHGYKNTKLFFVVVRTGP